MATIYEVAEQAGVSPMTASRILAGSSKRSKSRERVLRCAEELGYIRNLNAATLRTGRTRMIGIMVPFMDNPFYTKFLQEMHDILRLKEYQCLITCSFGETDSMASAVTLFGSYNVDGVIMDISEGVVNKDIKDKLAKIQQRGRAVTITGAQRQDIPYDHLYLDNKRAVYKLIKHLVARGYRSFGFIGGLASNLNIKQRLDAFQKALEEDSIQIHPDCISLGNPSLDSVTQRVHQMLRSPHRPRSIVCTSDMIAMVVIRAAQEIGLRVPQDVAVTGFDDIAQAALTTPSLTTIRQPLQSMASDIVNLILHRLDNPTAPIHKQQYEAELVIREST